MDARSGWSERNSLCATSLGREIAGAIESVILYAVREIAMREITREAEKGGPTTLPPR
jgi:hypothetical protein